MPHLLAPGGVGLCIDHTTRQLLSDTHLNLDPAEVLQRAHAKKAQRAPPTGFVNYPVASSSCGGFHEPSVSRMLAAWANALWTGHVDEDNSRGIRCAPRLVELVWQPRLSAAAHRGTADGLARLLHALRVEEYGGLDGGGGGGGGGDGDGGNEGGGEGGGDDSLQRGDVVGLDNGLRHLSRGVR
jgi:hypothetical protein